MHLISKVRDYYDSVMATGVDETILYKRKEEELPFEDNDRTIAYVEHLRRYNSFSNKLKNLISKKDEFEIFEYPRKRIYLSKYKTDAELYSGVVMFCGKVYPYLKIVETFSINPFDRIYVYSVEELEETLLKITDKEYVDNFLYKNRVYKYGNFKNKIMAYFDELSKIDCTDIHNEFDSPIVLLVGKKIIKNPLLREVSFMKVKDPYMAYMEISSFISGVMGGKTPRMIETSDVVRLEAHGFDKKISFRKRKA